MPDEMTKYGDLQCPQCGAHDTTIERTETTASGATLHLVCRPGGHKWTMPDCAPRRVET